MTDLPAFTTRRLERIAEDALAAAGVLGVLPTPLEALHPVAGVRAVEPMPALPERIRTPDRALLGALWFDERTICEGVSPRPAPVQVSARGGALPSVPAMKQSCRMAITPHSRAHAGHGVRRAR